MTGSEKSSIEKRLARIEEKRAKIDSDYNKAIARADTKAKEHVSRESKDITKAKERHERELKRREEKYAKEMRKLERKKQHEERKAEEKRKKAEQGDELTRMRRERDQSRRMAEVLKKESEILRERMGELQRENTALVQRLANLPGGRDVLREVKEESHQLNAL